MMFHSKILSKKQTRLLEKMYIIHYYGRLWNDTFELIDHDDKHNVSQYIFLYIKLWIIEVLWKLSKGDMEYVSMYIYNGSGNINSITVGGPVNKSIKSHNTLIESSPVSVTFGLCEDDFCSIYAVVLCGTTRGLAPQSFMGSIFDPVHIVGAGNCWSLGPLGIWART